MAVIREFDKNNIGINSSKVYCKWFIKSGKNGGEIVLIVAKCIVNVFIYIIRIKIKLY